MSTTRDPALDALLHPFADGALRWPELGALFLRAREGAALHAIGARGFSATQPFKPEAGKLERLGVEHEPGLDLLIEADARKLVA